MWTHSVAYMYEWLLDKINNATNDTAKMGTKVYMLQATKYKQKIVLPPDSALFFLEYQLSTFQRIRLSNNWFMIKICDCLDNVMIISWCKIKIEL